MAEVATSPDAFDLSVDVVIVGAGAAGLIAALSVHEAGHSVLVLERDAEPAGSTALSAGLIPAAGTQLQQAAGIEDSAIQFAADIQAKAHGRNDPALVELLTQHAAGVIDWLQAEQGLPFSVLDDFDYPGHSNRRMHGLPSRAGRALINALRSRCEALDIDIVCNARVDTLFQGNEGICGVGLCRPDGQTEQIGCRAVILACNGFGGNRALVQQHMPQIADAMWFGHDGNTGDAIGWGAALGARMAHLGSYQGHGNVAYPQGILITWAVITEGGFQVNADGQRFWNEAQGYSEAARAVLAQPGGVAWTIFDARIAAVARQFEDFKDAESQGAIRQAQTLAQLARDIGVPEGALQSEAAQIPMDGVDRFGRPFSARALQAPYCAVKVTGALFHTQGGLCIDNTARVVLENGASCPNLFAAGGAACGVSGVSDDGYLSGNGLLSAVVLGRIAGLNSLSVSTN